MQTEKFPTLEISLRVWVDYSLLLDKVIQGLKGEGFVVVTEIDLQEKLKKNLNVDTNPFKVMRVYHPLLTAMARSNVPEMALLPYNMTIAQLEDGDIELSFVDPLPVEAMERYPELIPIISTAYEALNRVAQSLPGTG